MFGMRGRYGMLRLVEGYILEVQLLLLKLKTTMLKFIPLLELARIYVIYILLCIVILDSVVNRGNIVLQSMQNCIQ